jgi:hypothetical protein
MRWTCALALAGALVLCASPREAQAGHAYRADCSSSSAGLCAALSDDGRRAVFPFAEPLVEGAGERQIYARGGGRTEAVSPIDVRQRPKYGAFLGASSDTRHVFVWTDYALAPEDTDAGSDIYDISGGRATLLSVDPTGGTGMLNYQGASADGSRVFMDALGGAMPAGSNACWALYERSGGTTTLLSPPPIPDPEARPRSPNSCALVRFDGVSGDGTHVFFTTDERLVPEDDGYRDIYQRVGDTVTLLTTYPESTGSNCVEFAGFADASADGRTVLFSTNVAISPEDHDADDDVYRREPDGSFTLVSRGVEGAPGGPGCGPGGSYFIRGVALAADGGIAIVETNARLVPEDHDSSADVYRYAPGGGVSLVTTGPTDPGVDETSVIGLWHPAVSDDARHVAFETPQPLVPEDRDRAFDVYVRAGDVTELVSTGPGAKPGKNHRADLLDISGDGLSVAFATKERLSPFDTDDAIDYYARRNGPRTVLLSAEGIPPEIRVGRRGRLLGEGWAAVRLACARTETTGPCRGTVSLRRGGKTVGRSRFRVDAGDGKPVAVRLREGAALSGRTAVLARVRAMDRLGNRTSLTRRVTLVGR